MTEHWHILRVKSGQELGAHELLERHGATCYTPFQTKFLTATKQRRAARKRIPYADPIFKGYLLFSFEDTRFILKLKHLCEHRSYLYGPLLASEGFYCLSRDSLAEMRSVYPTGYDKRLHSRKNRQRKYAQVIEVPKFTQGDVVRYLDGPMAGIDMRVHEVKDDKLRLYMTIFGSEREVSASAWELERKTA